MKHFSPSEFPEDISYADPKLLEMLDNFREELGVRIHPSPVPGALARFSGSPTSQHYAVDRLSTAVDVFVEASPAWVYIRALQFGWGGVGVYFDTHYNNRHWVMFHLDIRKDKTTWFRDDKEYFYPKNNSTLAEKLVRKLSIV